MAALSSLIAALVVTSVLGVVALVQAHHANDERDLATSRQLVANAQAQLEVDQELAVLLASKAYDTKPTEEAQAVLRQAVADSRTRAVSKMWVAGPPGTTRVRLPCAGAACRDPLRGLGRLRPAVGGLWAVVLLAAGRRGQFAFAPAIILGALTTLVLYT